MSSKFNPSRSTRRPPPQCKKSPPAPTVTALIGTDPMIAGQPLFISFRWFASAPEFSFDYTAASWARAEPNDFWLITIDEPTSESPLVGMRYFPDTNEFAITAEIKIGGISTFRSNDHIRQWNGHRPFHFPQTQIDFVSLGTPVVGMLTVGITA